jgi:GNAT superfamily N-acetyltransferase
MPASQPLPPDLIVRAATADDVPRLWEIRVATEAPNPASPPPAGPPSATLRHVVRSARVLVAEVNGLVVGFGGRADRSGVSFLTDLFVDPAWQSSAVGRTLLRELFQDAAATRFTLASSDPRAVALYTRNGMTPRWPNFDLVADAAQFRLPPEHRSTLREADPLDPAFLDLDASVGGRRRPEDLAFLRDEMAGTFFWVDGDAEPAGYAGVWREADDGVLGDTLAIGPVGGATDAAAREATLAAVAWAHPRARRLKISIPGPHPALPPLLEAGFRIDYIGTICASASVRLNPKRYVASGEDLF